MIRKVRKFRPAVGEAKLEERVVLSVAPAAIHIAARNVTYRVMGRFTQVDFVWDTAAKTVTFNSRAAGTIRGLGSFNVSGIFNNVAYNKAGQINGTITLTSSTDSASTLVFAVRGPSPGASPRGPVTTQENLRLTSATGQFAKFTNQPNSVGSIVLPALNLPMKPPPTITGVANLSNITINVRRP